MTDTGRLQAAIAAIDAANSEDPRQEMADGSSRPKELVYSERMTGWLARLIPEAPEALCLAVRCQHIRRWTIPRDQYPADRTGYRRWRSDLGRFHADTAAEILRQVGYDDDTIARVRSLVTKQHLKTDPQAQALEDVACLVFLEYYFADFVSQHDEAKLVSIVRKTWNKMSSHGHQAAAEIDLSPRCAEIVARALKAAEHDSSSGDEQIDK